MECSGECFVNIPSSELNLPIIVGRNSTNEELVGVAQEVILYEANDSLAGESNVGFAFSESDSKYRIILQKPQPGEWGGDYGVNEHNVVVGITWAKIWDHKDVKISPTDILRIVLASTDTAHLAVEKIGLLVSEHGEERFEANFIACDTKNVWLVSCSSNHWAAEMLSPGFHRISSFGFTVGAKKDICSDNVKNLENEDFGANFGKKAEIAEWKIQPAAESGSLDLVEIFDSLRAEVDPKKARASCVSVLQSQGISSHWFTATPNAAESVFKPFIFSLHPKISPLTAVTGDTDCTLLHKLHSQRKPLSIENLKALESSCIEEIKNYIAMHSVADEELDELMKDCVEAEVKFYR